MEEQRSQLAISGHDDGPGSDDDGPGSDDDGPGNNDDGPGSDDDGPGSDDVQSSLPLPSTAPKPADIQLELKEGHKRVFSLNCLKLRRDAQHIAGLLYRPQFMDWRFEFGDGEAFLVEGDSILLDILARGLVEWTDIGGSSLHVIWLLEKILRQFVDRGARPNLVFFSQMEVVYQDLSLRVLRKIVIGHFSKNTDIAVLSAYDSAVDKSFIQFLREQSVLSAALSVVDILDDDKTRPRVFVANIARKVRRICFLQMALLVTMGVDCAEVDDAVVTLASISGFHISRSSVPNTTKKILAKAYLNELADLKPESAILSEVPIINESEHVALDMCARVVRELLAQNMAIDANELKCSIHVYLLLAALRSKQELVAESDEENKNVDLRLLPSSPVHTFFRMVLDLESCYLESMTSQPELVCLLSYASVGAKLIYYHSQKPKLFVSILSSSSVRAFMDAWNIKYSELFMFGECVECHINLIRSIEVRPKKVVPSCAEAMMTPLVKLDNDLYSRFTGEPHQKGEAVPKASFVGMNTQFEEKYHWHVLKPLAEELQQHESTNLWAVQKYNSHLTKYGTSIEGGIVSDKPIVVEREVKGGKKVKSKGKGKHGGGKQSASGKMSSKQKIILNHIVDKAKKEYEKVKSGQVPLTRLGAIKSDLLNSVAEHEILAENADIDNVLKSISSLFYKNELEDMKGLFGQINMSNREQTSTQEVSFLLKVKKADSNGMIQAASAKMAGSMANMLRQLGYTEYARHLVGASEEDPKLKADQQQQSLARFQLKHMGAHFEMEKPPNRDPRVDSFNPDLWQRQLFDAIDKKQSALIIAPTSSGKTYASYYCMEQVLRESDDGVVVYVAPTKALVNQVAATVYARFAKRKVRPSGSVQGVFTRDYRHNVNNCQILVTVPQCLEILLISPQQIEWSRRVKYVIFDEVHNIGSENAAEVWERTLLLVQCPFLALSATVENPLDLHRWLTSMEQFKRERQGNGRRSPGSFHVNYVHYKERHSDLIKYVTNAVGEQVELNHVHPYALLNVPEICKQLKFPEHVGLSSAEALELHTAMSSVMEGLEDLDPTRFLGERFFSRNEVKRFAEALQQELVKSLAQESEHVKRCRLLGAVLSRLKGFSKEHKSVGNSLLPQEVEERQFVDLMNKLRESNMLPALIFTFERSLCKILPDILCSAVDSDIKHMEETESYKNKKEEDERLQNSRAAKAQRKKQSNVPEEATVKKGKSKSGQQTGEVSEPAHEWFTSLESKFPGMTFADIGKLSNTEYLYDRLDRETDFFKLLPYGLSWHHAGNHKSQRDATEMLFRSGFLRTVVSTTTLAQGIHMPCKTVIFYHHNVFLNTLTYHQCAGRAGRRGLDPVGNVIFFKVPEAKISRLMTAPLTKLLGNEPISLTLILRLFVLISGNPAMSLEERQSVVARALCLLKQPYILQSRPNIESSLKNFFHYCVDFLYHHGYVDSAGVPIGFSGLATHLHYKEPFNFAFCHILKDGSLHSLCRRTSQGCYSEDTMVNLLVVVCRLFARKKLSQGYYEKNKSNFDNSLVRLEKFPEAVRDSIDNFCTMLKMCMQRFVRASQEKCQTGFHLPLSGFQYGSLHAIESSALVDIEDISLLLSNTPNDMQLSFVPAINQNELLNRFVLDFYMHGSLKALRSDNAMQEGELFERLNDCRMVLQAIATSLRAIGPEDVEDDVIGAFGQLAKEFDHKFMDAFPDLRSYKRKGSVRLHTANCEACSYLQESEQIEHRGFTFRVRGLELTCETRNVIFLIRCRPCAAAYVGKTVQPMSVKMREYTDEHGTALERVRTHFRGKHKCLELFLLATFKSDEEGERFRVWWMQKLWAVDVAATGT